MCVYSVVMDMGRDRWITSDFRPREIPPWSELEWKDLLKKIKSIDKKLGMENCEDPKKAEFSLEFIKMLNGKRKVEKVSGQHMLEDISYIEQNGHKFKIDWTIPSIEEIECESET